MTHKKIYQIDNLRTVAILVVMLGHSIILYSSRWSLYQPPAEVPVLDEVKKWVDIFIMPLFFSLSGYLFALSGGQNGWGKFLLKKSRRLLVPFVLVGALYMIPLKMLLHYPGYEGKSYSEILFRFLCGFDQGHLWYLPTVFLLFAALFPLKRLLCRHLAGGIGLMALLAVACLEQDRLPLLGLPYLKNLYKFGWAFALGIVLCRLPPQKGRQKELALISAGLLAVGWFLRGTTTLPLAAGILSLFYLLMPNRPLAPLAPIAKNEYGLYLFHSPLIYLTLTWLSTAAPWMVVEINFLLLGTVAFGLTELVRKTPLRILVGE